MRRPLVVMVAVAALLGGCGIGAADLPLPGSSVGGPTYGLTAEFDDALNLSIGAPVKLRGVPIGRVRSVESRNFTASVRMDIKTRHRLHEGATARLRSTTPLGELFVEMDDSDGAATLADGARLTTGSTSTAPSIEDSMAATSLLLNGGNLTQLGTIIKETNTALDGRQTTARDLLTRLTTTTEAFASSADDITQVLTALASVSATLDRRENTINAALEDVTPAARTLRRNTDELVDLLSGVSDLGAVSKRVIDTTQADLLQVLDQAGPVLDQLLTLREDLGPNLDDLVRFAELLDRGVPTDYLNSYLFIDDSLRLGLPGSEEPTVGGDPTTAPSPATLDIPSLGDLLGGFPAAGVPSAGDNPLTGLLGTLLGGDS